MKEAGELKSNLERAARLRKVPVSSVLDLAVRDLLKSNADVAGDEALRELHSSVERCLGVLAGGNSRRAEDARKDVRDRIPRRRERPRAR